MKVKKKLSEYNLAFVDTETTGLNEDEHEIIEIGVLIYNQQTDQIEDEWETKIAPTHIETASQTALRINGYINNPELYRGSLKSALIKFNSLVEGCIIVGQNVSFDLKFINKVLKELNITPKFDRRYLELMGLSWWAVKDSDLPGISLESLCNHFNIPNIGAHSALIDCRRAFEVYRNTEKYLKSHKG